MVAVSNGKSVSLAKDSSVTNIVQYVLPEVAMQSIVFPVSQLPMQTKRRLILAIIASLSDMAMAVPDDCARLHAQCVLKPKSTDLALSVAMCLVALARLVGLRGETSVTVQLVRLATVPIAV